MIAKAASRRRCHSHQLNCQLRLTTIAMSASASRTSAAAMASRSVPPRYPYCRISWNEANA
jgi:hypothetical protein